MKKQKFYVQLRKTGELRKVEASCIEDVPAIADEKFGVDTYDVVGIKPYVKVSRKELKETFQALTGCDDRTANLLTSIRSI